MPNIARTPMIRQFKDPVWLAEQLAIKTYVEIAEEIGCTRQAVYRAAARHGITRDPEAPGGRKRVYTIRVSKTQDGYRDITRTDPDGVRRSIREHRWVMEQSIGRKLLPHENVHHLNGVRDDNRIENLELWSKSQPSGQRAKDKVKHARYILSLYGDMYPED